MGSWLLIGGGGFLGKNSLNYLRDRHNCLSLTRTTTTVPSFLENCIQKNPYEEKIPHNQDILVQLIDPKHLPLREVNGAELKCLTNVIHPQSKHIIFISSAAAYLDIPSEYGERKKTLEKVYQGFCSDRGIKLTILRIFNTFGPYQKIGIQGSLIANIFKSHLLSKPIPISNLESKRDFFFAPILGPILEHVAVNSLEGIYDVASGNLYSIGGLIRLIENEVIHSPLIKSDVNHSSATFSRAGRGPLVDRFGNFNFISALKETYSSIKEAFLV